MSDRWWLQVAMVCGSRGWRDPGPIVARLKEFPIGWRVVHGDAIGADLIAAGAATAMGFPVQAFPPDESIPSPARFHVRNDQMLAIASLVLAFWDGTSPGTGGVIEKAKKRGIPYEVIGEERD